MFLNVEKRRSEQMVSETYTRGKTTNKPAEQKKKKKAPSLTARRDGVSVLIKALTCVNRPLKKYEMFKKEFLPGDPQQPNLL